MKKIDWKKLKPGKRTIIVSLVALLAVGAVWLNWKYQNADAEAESKALASEYEAVESRRILGENYAADPREAAAQGDGADRTEKDEVLADFFDATRLSRKQARDEAVSILESTEASATASAEAKANASEEIAALAANTVIESRIEGLVMAKGFKDCVAYINSNGCNVVVAPTGAELRAEDVAKIKDIVVSETGLEASMIKIVEAAG
ncbi:MAG: SpoIIIAH-like family protein [Clostridia bacterium]|nr:SpoIIIAH-like family protein [Clostridia bacterium]